ncbi:MAG TPA: type II secretion system protein N [Burkholderiales bacterium]|nr:type II secretion system protein N [Burkholderiales bacterium]
MRHPNVVRLASIILAIALVASATGWVLNFVNYRTIREPLRALPADAVSAAVQSADTQRLAQLFGSTATDSLNGIRTLGVIAEGSTGRGIALIGINGQPARTIRAGEQLAPGIVLAEVRHDGVVVNRGGDFQQIRLAKKEPPAGVLRAP